ncbi:hypothetical protein D9611_000999 [Ephemerocybe angulata]|uniref:Uncharacterized protein n=1 Tax=Ephemerocybe angulata TaxID=980116 RepID=A0A8H5BMJ9_9AGAR|nr:hypothetical protein D9611_000999 [Tulosesus angulatus]
MKQPSDLVNGAESARQGASEVEEVGYVIQGPTSMEEEVGKDIRRPPGDDVEPPGDPTLVQNGGSAARGAASEVEEGDRDIAQGPISLEEGARNVVQGPENAEPSGDPSLVQNGESSTQVDSGVEEEDRDIAQGISGLAEEGGKVVQRHPGEGAEMHGDPILAQSGDVKIVFPIRYPSLWQMYTDARDAFWRPAEIDLSVDIRQWSTHLTEGERFVLTRVLAFFATADGLVAENLVERFSQDVAIFEAKYFYGFQIMMENIHAETYARLIDALIQDEKEKQSVLKWSVDLPSISAKNQWAAKWITDARRSFAERLVAFACVEGIFFSSSFAVIFWFKEKGVMPGLCQSNDLISRDEGMHTDFACSLLRELRDRPSEYTVQSIVAEAVKIESDFVTDSLSTHLLGLPVRDMHGYIRYAADRLLENMGYLPMFRVQNPLPQMLLIGLPSRTNIFEKRSTEYRLPLIERSEDEDGAYPQGVFG